MRRPSLLVLLVLPTLAAAQAERGIAVPVLDSGHTKRKADALRLELLSDRLFQAVREGQIANVRVLIAKGANPNRPDASGNVALASLGGTPETMLAVARLLVAKGAKANPPLGVNNPTPLIGALNISEEPVGLVRFLIERGADLNRADADGNTPLHFAVRNGYAASAAALLEGGARVDVRTRAPVVVRTHDDPPSLAIRQSIERDRIQSAHTCEPGYRETGQTPVFGLAQRFDPAVAARLLKAGAKLGERDDSGWTPLHHAVHNGNQAAVRGLLALGADPNAASKGGYTPLHLAVRAEHGLPSALIAGILIKAGADPKRQNRDGQTPLDLLRADVQWRLGNPTHDPHLEFSASRRAPHLQDANAVARVLDPGAAPIVFTPAEPDPEGTVYIPLEIGDAQATRTVRVERGRAVLDLRLAPPTDGPSTLTISAIALESCDTLTPLPVVVPRTKGVPTTLSFEFPLVAAQGGALDVAYRVHGPGNEGASGTAGDDREAAVGVLAGNPVTVFHTLGGRTLEFEILSVARGGKPLTGFAGRVLRVEADESKPVAGLLVEPSGGSKHSQTVLRYRYRFLPNTRWRTNAAAL